MYDKGCRDCPLWEGRHSVCVPGRGDLKSEILVLGQAPGKTEDATNSPFVGRAGLVLNEALKRLELEDKVYIDNTARCWPPGDREPTPAEVKACSKYTEAVVAAMPNLKVVVALGNTPLRYLTKRTGISKKAGKPQTGRIGEKAVLVLPTYHPAYVLRNPLVGDSFLAHLESVKTMLTNPNETQPKVFRGYVAADKIRRLIHRTSWAVGFDLETTGLDPEKGSILMAGFFSGQPYRQPFVAVNDHPEFLVALREFAESRVKKVVHNVAFESAWCEKHLGVRLNNVIADTMILSKRWDENRSAALGEVAAVFFREKAGYKLDTEAALEAGEKWWDLPTEQLAFRCGYDAKAADIIHSKLKKILGPEVMDYHRAIDIPIAIAVKRMSGRGLKVDEDRLNELEKRYEEQQDKAVKDAKRQGIKAPLSSPVQLAQNLLDLGIDTGVWGAAHAKTGKRQMSTSEDALLWLLSHNPELKKLVQPILDYRAADKMLSTYVRGLRKEIVNGFVYSSFRFPGTVTWRLASREPNLQNIPIRTELGRDFRSVFISRYPKGNIVSADYSQAELRVLASMSRDEAMIDAYKRGLDIHSITAAKAYGKDFTKEQRATSKNGNFAIVYGAAAAKISETLRIPEEEAQAIEAGFKKSYPQAWEFMRSLQKLAKEQHFVEAPLYKIVRHLPPPTTPFEAAQIAREGANSPIQCGAAMLTLSALRIAEDRLDSDTGILISCVHDELVVDAPGNGRRAAKILRESMLDAVSRHDWIVVPFAVDASVGPNWFEQEEVYGS